eukprot:gb/GECG01005781.1/.p1 GENE.gb/GECG01005781.1/~~gb/GECG01005781.1/.p1  ORF type:complete len:129 (+),score=42.25 gb/GECG01005781.1/:1-387(+)
MSVPPQRSQAQLLLLRAQQLPENLRAARRKKEQDEKLFSPVKASPAPKRGKTSAQKKKEDAVEIDLDSSGEEEAVTQPKRAPRRTAAASKKNFAEVDDDDDENENEEDDSEEWDSPDEEDDDEDFEFE